MASSIEVTLKHALFFARHLNRCDLQCAAVAVLLDLGLAPRFDGFDYLVKAIAVCRESPVATASKDVYPVVSLFYDTRPDGNQIEQAIRSAIYAAWVDRDEEVWVIYFPRGADGKIKKPSNAEFISRIARFLELWQGCCKGVAYERT